MNKAIITVIFLTILTGCGRAPSQKEGIVLARVNNYEITLDEFQDEFKKSPHSRSNTPQSKKDFLNSLIDRKLILQDAQRKDIDKDEAFLKLIERFWEQSLLRIALENKAAEISGSASVSDHEVQEAYRVMLREGRTEKSYNDMYKQIKWELNKSKEAKLMKAWIEFLRNEASIQIDDKLLGQNR